ncbi:MAG: hypothetical protein ABRQ38_23570 [Candidatus Eremiobacterota bacterium]
MKIHIILLTCLISLLISGCGGGGDTSGVIPNNVPVQSTPTPGTLVQVPDNQTTPSIPSYLPGGTFNVTVQFPGSASGAKHRDMSSSDVHGSIELPGGKYREEWVPPVALLLLSTFRRLMVRGY